MESDFNDDAAAEVSGEMRSNTDPEECCTLCGKSFGDDSVVAVQPIKTEKGLRGLQNACTKRGDKHTFYVGQRLHKQCRHVYTNKKAIANDAQKQNTEEDSQTRSPAKTRSKIQKPFDFSADCFLCGQSVKSKQDSERVFSVRSFECERSFLDKCSERGDKWGQAVTSRIENVNDLHAADAVYHQQCSINFRTNKHVPMKRRLVTHTHDISKQGAKKGRPVDEEQVAAFLSVTQHLEDNDDEQITLTDLRLRMRQFLQAAGRDKEPYTEKHLRQKLEAHFGDSIIVTSIRGTTNAVAFRSTAEKIVGQFSQMKEKDSEHSNMYTSFNVGTSMNGCITPPPALEFRLHQPALLSKFQSYNKCEAGFHHNCFRTF